MSLLANQQIRNISLFSIRVIQTQRIFDLIQQNVKDPKAVITMQNLQSFTQKYYEAGFNKASRILNILQKQGLQLNEDNFKMALACEVYQSDLSSVGTLVNYYQAIKKFFHLQFSQKIEQIDRWDVLEPSTPQNVNKRQLGIKQFFSQLSPFVHQFNILNFQGALGQINFCFSVTAISNNQNDINTVYQTFTTVNIMNFLANFCRQLSQNSSEQIYQQNLAEAEKCLQYLKLIAHLYGAYRYKLVRQKIQSSFLFFHQTFSILLKSLKIQNIQIKYQIMVCFGLLSKHSQSFIEWILADVSNVLIPLLMLIQKTEDESTNYCSLVFLKNIVKAFEKQSQAFKNNEKNIQILFTIYEFAYHVLKTSQILLSQKQCILIINQILLINRFPSSQIQQINIINGIYSAQQSFQFQLVPGALKILETSLIYKVEDLTHNIIKNEGFINCMLKNIVKPNSSLFYYFIHIAYLLSYDYSAYLIEKGIFIEIIKLMQASNSILISIGSDIIFNVVQQGLQNEKILEALYQKFALFDQIVPALFEKCFQTNEFLNLLISRVIAKTQQTTKNYNYFNKFVFINIFKIIFCLSTGISRKHKKLSFAKRLTIQLVNSISNIIRDLFNFDNQPLVSLILRSKIKIVDCKKLKLEDGIQFFKLIHTILEEMTYNMQGRSIQLLRLIYFTKKSYCNYLMKYFKLQDIQLHNIVIFLTLELNIQVGQQRKTLRRDVPHKFQLSSIKSYLKLITQKLFNLQENRKTDIKIYSGNKDINSQAAYRGLIQSCITKSKPPFLISLDIKQQIQVRQRRNDLSQSYVNAFDRRGLSTLRTNRYDNNSIDQKISRSRYLNNTMRQPLRNSYYSPHNLEASYKQKSNSPMFGGYFMNKNK